MKQVTLQFPTAEDVWNFLATTRKAHVEVEEATAQGWFSEEEVQLALDQYSATVQPFTRKETPAPAPSDEGQPVELLGKSGRVYPGRIYSKTAGACAPGASGLVCLANSTYTNGTWKHQVNAIFTTDDVEGERLRFSQRSDISHFIVVPPEEWRGSDAADDLIRSYLHG